MPRIRLLAIAAVLAGCVGAPAPTRLSADDAASAPASAPPVPAGSTGRDPAGNETFDCSEVPPGSPCDAEPRSTDGGGSAPPAVKPRRVDCDAVEPGMPCTPDLPPEGLDEPPHHRKPHHVDCDAVEPGMPCTPEPTPPDRDAPPPPGVKPHYVDCAKVQPGMPCTPEGTPGVR